MKSHNCLLFTRLAGTNDPQYTGGLSEIKINISHFIYIGLNFVHSPQTTLRSLQVNLCIVGRDMEGKRK